MNELIAYVSEGRLYLSESGGSLSEVESEFARKAREAEREIIRKKEMKPYG